MAIEAEVQIMKAIKLSVSNDDVDGFLEDLEELFTSKKPLGENPELNKASSIFSTLHKMWLEVKQQL